MYKILFIYFFLASGIRICAFNWPDRIIVETYVEGNIEAGKMLFSQDLRKLDSEYLENRIELFQTTSKQILQIPLDISLSELNTLLLIAEKPYVRLYNAKEILLAASLLKIKNKKVIDLLLNHFSRSELKELLENNKLFELIRLEIKKRINVQAPLRKNFTNFMNFKK